MKVAKVYQLKSRRPNVLGEKRAPEKVSAKGLRSLKGDDGGFFKQKTGHFCHLKTRVSPEILREKNYAMSRLDKLKHQILH